MSFSPESSPFKTRLFRLPALYSSSSSSSSPSDSDDSLRPNPSCRDQTRSVTPSPVRASGYLSWCESSSEDDDDDDQDDDDTSVGSTGPHGEEECSPHHIVVRFSGLPDKDAYDDDDTYDQETALRYTKAYCCDDNSVDTDDDDDDINETTARSEDERARHAHRQQVLVRSNLQRRHIRFGDVPHVREFEAPPLACHADLYYSGHQLQKMMDNYYESYNDDPQGPPLEEQEQEDLCDAAPAY